MPPRRPKAGPVEAALHKDLDVYPKELREGGVAAGALFLARELDNGPDMSPRDKAGHVREIRLAMAYLAEIAPGEAAGDSTDEKRERREGRLRAVAE